MSTVLLTGIAGMLLILGAFVSVQIHRLSPDDLSYDVLNAVGSVLLAINAALTHAWPFLVLNCIWGFFACRDIWLQSAKSGVLRPVRKDLTSPLVHKHRTLSS